MMRYGMLIVPQKGNGTLTLRHPKRKVGLLILEKVHIGTYRENCE